MKYFYFLKKRRHFFSKKYRLVKTLSTKVTKTLKKQLQVI